MTAQDSSNDIAKYLEWQLLEALYGDNGNHGPDFPASDSFDSILFGETSFDQNMPTPLLLPHDVN